MNKLTALGCCIVAAAASSAFADAKPNGIFSSHMVLQRDRAVPVWGTAEPGEQVTIRFAGNDLKATADAKGRWQATLPAMKWSAEPRTLVVAGKSNEVALEDVLVGDVWLVSGQSNAEMPLNQYVQNYKAEQARAKDFPNIRQVKFRHETALYPQTGDPCCSAWKIVTDTVLNNVTAAGYFMVRELNEKTGIPMGILDDNWSGSRIEPFLNDKGIATVPELAQEAEKIGKYREAMLKMAGRVAAAQADGDFGSLGTLPEPNAWTTQYNAMIAPITKFPIVGLAWYQGCSNGGEEKPYIHKLTALINGWRTAWGYDFPVYVVQIAAFNPKTTDPQGGNHLSRVREAQRVVVQRLPKCGLAVAIDIGDATNIHPHNKQDVGHRLALWARRDIYGEKGLVVSGPLFKSMKVEGSTLRLEFDHLGGGLVTAEKKPNTPGELPVETPGAELKGFAITGADRKWTWAKAKIDGDTVVVSADGVDNPIAVRYAFRANPMGDCNLYNKAGLPASPFHTDEW